MPGIVGLITQMPRRLAEPQLKRMMATLYRESFYTSGTFIDEANGLYVGWTARRGSFSDGMPLKNEREDVVLIFSGEEFAEPGTAARLKTSGHACSESGNSYLVHLYEEQSSFPAGLNGRFHGVVADRARNRVALFNDRFGMHRLYWYEGKDAFYFSAEAKGILAVVPETRRMDMRGAGEFVSCGAVLENRTLFEGISLLPQGSAWVFQDGALQQRNTYFDVREWEEQEALQPEAYYQELKLVFARNLARYFEGPEAIAMSLTGGLDTRMILALRKPEAGSLPCYTFGSMFRENEDVRVARLVATECGQPFQTLCAGTEFLSRFDDFATRSICVTEGCADVSRSADLYLNEKAREIAPVRMTGNYGGEIFRRVRAFKAVEPPPGIFAGAFMAAIREAEQAYTRVVSGHPVTVAAFRQGPWYLYGVLALEETQLSMRTPYIDNDLLRTVFRAPSAALASSEVSMRLIEEGNRALLGIPTDRGFGGKRGRAAESASHAVLEFLFKAEYAFDMGMPQWLAETNWLLGPLRPERFFLGRHKPCHFRVWYRDALAGYVREILLDAKALSRPYVDRAGMKAAVSGHLKGNRNHTTEIHKLLTLELVHRLLLDNAGRGNTDETIERTASLAPVH